MTFSKIYAQELNGVQIKMPSQSATSTFTTSAGSSILQSHIPGIVTRKLAKVTVSERKSSCINIYGAVKTETPEQIEFKTETIRESYSRARPVDYEGITGVMCVTKKVLAPEPYNKYEMRGSQGAKLGAVKSKGAVRIDLEKDSLDYEFDKKFGNGALLNGRKEEQVVYKRYAMVTAPPASGPIVAKQTTVTPIVSTRSGTYKAVLDDGDDLEKYARMRALERKNRIEAEEKEAADRAAAKKAKLEKDAADRAARLAAETAAAQRAADEAAAAKKAETDRIRAERAAREEKER